MAKAETVCYEKNWFKQSKYIHRKIHVFKRTDFNGFVCFAKSTNINYNYCFLKKINDTSQ